MAKTERLGSDAFQIEYEQHIKDAELRDEVVSYLGEYRLNLQKYNYQLLFSLGDDGFAVRDSYRGESLLLKAKRAVEQRKKQGKPVHREEAEERGIIKLDNKLSQAKLGDRIFWASPPGPKEQGCGDYGFIYAGEVITDTEEEKQIQMTAIRIEHSKFDQSTIEQYNSVLSQLTGRMIKNTYTDQFLESPEVVLTCLNSSKIESVLQAGFGFIHNQDELGQFQKIIQRLNPLINEFILLVKHGTKEEKLRAFHALENYTLELKSRYSFDMPENAIFLDDYRNYRLWELARVYGYEPPQVAGSCGSTGNPKSSNILVNGYENLRKAIFGEDQDKCEVCETENLDNHYHCPKCKKQYSDETEKSDRTEECSCGYKFGC